MTLEPLASASHVIQIHTAAAVTAAVFGCAVLVQRKGTALHRSLGYGFVAAMFVTATSSFWITAIVPGRYSPIHVLSIITLISLPLAIVYRRRGNIRGHSRAMIAPFIGLMIAGVATLLPGRVLHRVFF
ncbi:MAG: DUF2306 domain-containing protein [Beijerinckiaceae bacterium]